MRRSSISSQGSSSSTGASIELSRFVNGPSFIGRELARRIVLMSTILGPGSDGAAENEACLVWRGYVPSRSFLYSPIFSLGGEHLCSSVFIISVFRSQEQSIGSRWHDEEYDVHVFFVGCL